MTTNSTLNEEAQTLAAYTKGFARRLRLLAEDWAEIQKWAERAAKDAENAARSRWAREGKSGELSAEARAAAEAVIALS